MIRSLIKVTPSLLAALCLTLTAPASAQTLPDLTVTKVTAPFSGSTAHAGANFSVRFWVRSHNAPVSTSFVVKFFFCTSAALATCTTLGSINVTNGLSAGQTRHHDSPSFNVPASARYGARYVRISVDADDAVPETDENNNWASTAIQITTRPDLVIATLEAPRPKMVLLPNTAFAAEVGIRNQAGTSALAQAFSVSYYYCPGASIGGCTPLASEQVAVDLHSGSTLVHGSVKLTLPATAQSGTRYLRAEVDSTLAVMESDENNNATMSPMVVSQTKPDLQVDQTVVPQSGAASAAQQAFTARCRVRNTADVALNKSFQLNYYYCPTKSGSGCAYLGQQQVAHAFKGKGATTITSPTLQLPVTAVHGAGYVRFFVDGTDQVAEANEGNNSRYHAVSVTARPDLWVAKTVVPASGSVAQPGDQFTARTIVSNKPMTSAFDAPFSVALFYCPTKASAGCVALGQQQVNTAFNSGAALTINTPKLTLPATAAVGLSYFRVLVDAKDQLTEGDETNNDHYSPLAVTGPPDAGAPDQAADLGGPDSGADAGVDAGVDGSVEAGPDLAAADAAADVSTADQAARDRGQEAWFWPDGSREAGKADARDLPQPPVTATGCDCRVSLGGGPGWTWWVGLLLWWWSRRGTRGKGQGVGRGKGKGNDKG